MTVMNDTWIKRYCKYYSMISPFSATLNRKGISYGLSSYGYDIRLGLEFKTYTNTIIDPKKDMPYDTCRVPKGLPYYIPPNNMALAVSMEHFKIPETVLGLCIGKSTYARCGLLVNTTPLEPGWEGYLTLELSNTTSLPIRVYPGEGIAQVIFFEGNDKCDISYSDRGGKYQDQDNSPILPRM